MNVVLGTIINRMKNTKEEDSNVKKLTAMMDKSPLHSSSSTLYNDNTTFLKVFNNDKVSQILLKHEYNAYRFLNTIKELEPYVPKMIQGSMQKNNGFLLLENRGIDALELINSKDIEMDFSIWVKFMVHVSTALTILHDYGISHGDMKPENVTYDQKTGKWSIIDFGFARRNNCTPCKFHGTIPYCSPHIADNYIRNRTKKSTNLDSNVVNDIFGFAMSALTIFGYYFNVETMPHVKYSVTNLIKIHNGDMSGLCLSFIPKNAQSNDITVKVLKLLATIVLTQIDFEYSEVVWVKHSCKCYFSGKKHLDCDITNFDIGKYWEELLTIIRN